MRHLAPETLRPHGHFALIENNLFIYLITSMIGEVTIMQRTVIIFNGVLLQLGTVNELLLNLMVGLVFIV